jgi:tetratricopeptide (TPR) repeat protein
VRWKARRTGANAWEEMDISYEELCRRCFGIARDRSFEDDIESCGGVIAADRDRQDVERADSIRGLLRADIGDPIGAIEDYGRTIALTPEARYFECRGQAYRVKGDDAAALSDFARAAELDPANSMPHVYTGDVHAHRGDPRPITTGILPMRPLATGRGAVLISTRRSNSILTT